MANLLPYILLTSTPAERWANNFAQVDSMQNDSAKVLGNIFALGNSLWDIITNGMAMKLLSFQYSAGTHSNDAADVIANTVWTVYDSFKGPVLTFVSLFILIALIKEIINAPEDQTLRRILVSLLKYGIIIGVIVYLQDITNAIFQITNGITYSISQTVGLELTDTGMDSQIYSALDDYCGTFPTHWILNFGKKTMPWVFGYILLFIAGIAYLGISIYAGISIIQVAYSRILKPLILLPLSGFAVATGAGSSEEARTMNNFFKMVIAYALSGALMILCIQLGNTLMNSFSLMDYMNTSGTLAGIAGNASYGIILALIIAIQQLSTPLVISGLVKSSEDLITRVI